MQPDGISNYQACLGNVVDTFNGTNEQSSAIGNSGHSHIIRRGQSLLYPWS